jgi:serine/threonine protein kinase
MEYIPGFSVSDMARFAPSEDWQEIIDQAKEVVNTIGDCNVLNMDVRPGNMLVSPTGDAAQKYRVVQIDLGQASLRGSKVSEKTWGRSKWTIDEPGHIGNPMELRLAELGFELVNEPYSGTKERYEEWNSAKHDYKLDEILREDPDPDWDLDLEGNWGWD